MRGKDKEEEMCDAEYRITPAYAGKSGFSVAKGAIAEDHPRLCGEKFPSPSPPTYAEGSPPPMRGKAEEIAQNAPRIEDHPRLCGEKMTLATTILGVLGSPPPMRGKD